VDHTRGLRGHKKVGLNNALDGSEDQHITREARLFWLEADMAAERVKAIAEVDALVDSGEIANFSDWRKLIAHPEDPGVVEDEGAEFEGEYDEEECMWDDDVDGAMAADDQDLDGVDEPSRQLVVQALPGDALADVADAVIAARRLQALKRLRTAAVADNVPAAAFHVDREVNQLERGLRAGGRKEEREVNEVLRRHMDKVFQEERGRIQQKQSEAFKRRNNLAKVKAALAKAKALKANSEEEKKALKQKLAKLPQKFTVAMFQQLGGKGTKARTEALERIKLRAPKLSLIKEEQWPDVCNSYASRVPVRFKWKGGEKAWGVSFAKSMDKLLRDLGTWYEGPSLYSKKGMKGGSETAFVQFFDLMVLTMPAVIGEIVC
jgi:hypothetical protein